MPSRNPAAHRLVTKEARQGRKDRRAMRQFVPDARPWELDVLMRSWRKTPRKFVLPADSRLHPDETFAVGRGYLGNWNA